MAFPTSPEQWLNVIAGIVLVALGLTLAVLDAETADGIEHAVETGARVRGSA